MILFAPRQFAFVGATQRVGMLPYPLAQRADSDAAAGDGESVFAESAYFIPCEHDVVHEIPQHSGGGIADACRYGQDEPPDTHGICQQFP